MTGSFVGLGLHSSRQNMLRAVLDSICYRVYDNVRAEELSKVEEFRVDGGMTKNKGMMQFQADLLGVKIKVCRLDTMWGVAKGAMKGVGVEREKEIESVVGEIEPGKEREAVLEGYKRWNAERWRS